MFTKRLRKYVIITIISILTFSFITQKVIAEKNVVTEYYTNVTLTTVEVYEDNDDGNKGEIYCESTINEVDYRTETIDEVDNGDTIIYNENLYFDWCSFLNIVIAVWDDDSEYFFESDPDRMGTASFNLFPTNGTFWDVTYDPDDERNEANVTISIYTLNMRTITVPVYYFILTPITLLGLIMVIKIKANKKPNNF